MQTPTIKTFVVAVVEPMIAALKSFYADTVDNMVRHVRDQDETITKNQTNIIKTQNTILGINNRQIEIISKINQLQNSIVTTAQVAELQNRVTELTYICNALYHLVATKLPDEKLPDFEHPVIPEDNK